MFTINEKVLKELIERERKLEAEARDYDPQQQYREGNLLRSSGLVKEVVKETTLEGRKAAHIQFSLNGSQRTVSLTTMYSSGNEELRDSLITDLEDLIRERLQVKVIFRINSGHTMCQVLESEGVLYVKPAGATYSTSVGLVRVNSGL